MEVIPAIDLMKGNVVRLHQGDPSTAKAYPDFGNPIDVAKQWKDEGARTIHIIDLDAVFNTGQNLQTVAEITEEVDLSIHLGGGIRKYETAEKILNMGIARIIIGTLAFRLPESLLEIQKRFGTHRLIVALDNRNGRVMDKGWKSSTGITTGEALEKFSKYGIERFLITCIDKDGTLTGPDFEMLANVCSFPCINVIAAGGISDLKDISNLRRTGVEGAVVGKALYEKKITLSDALLVGKGGLI